jgi:IS1 family transposase
MSFEKLRDRHRPLRKETGVTAHIERFNNTLRQRCANLVRRTLSFSKDQHCMKSASDSSFSSLIAITANWSRQAGLRQSR